MPGFSLTAPGQLAKLKDTDVEAGDGEVIGARLVFDADAGVWVPRTRSPFDGAAGDPLANIWNSGPTLPLATKNHNPVVIGNKLHLPGGADAGGTAQTRHDVYDTDNNAWTTAAALPAARERTAHGLIGGVLYLGGTFGDTAAYAYFPESNTWSLALAAAPTPTGGGAGRVQGSTMLGRLWTIEDGSGTTGRLFAYDPMSNTWAEHAPMPAPRTSGTVFAAGGKLYYLGGLEPGTTSALATCHRYDPVLDAWDQLRPLPTALAGSAAIVTGGIVYLLGGRDTAGVTDTMRAYTPKFDAYDELPDAQLPQTRMSAGAGLIAGRIYQAGGQRTTGATATVALDIYG